MDFILRNLIIVIQLIKLFFDIFLQLMLNHFQNFNQKNCMMMKKMNLNLLLFDRRISIKNYFIHFLTFKLLCDFHGVYELYLKYLIFFQ